MAPIKSLTTTLTLLLTTLTLTTTAQSPSNTTNTTTTASASSSSSAPLSAASLSSLALPGGTASPRLTLFMYDDPDCTYFNSSANSLVNVLPLSYNASSPQYPFWAFMMTRDLTSREVLTFYSSSNSTGAGPCDVAVGNLTVADMGGEDGLGAGVCVPIGGATCYNLTVS